MERREEQKGYRDGLDRGRETLARTGGLTPTTQAIIAAVTVITVKDSAEAIFRASANMLTMVDGNLWTVLI